MTRGLDGLNPLHAVGLGVGLHRWRNDRGHEFYFTVHHIDADLPYENVVYVLVRQILGACFQVYWGMASDVTERFANHHKFDAARREGANEVHLLHLPNSTRERRNELEMSFLHANPTQLNETGNKNREIANALMGMGQRVPMPIHSAKALAAFLQSPPQQAGFAKSPPPFTGLVPGAESYPFNILRRSPLDDVV